MTIDELADIEIPDVIALWEACQLTRPWNDPRADAERALHGTTSTILVRRSEDSTDPASVGATQRQIVGTVMVGIDGHRGWIYYLAVDPQHRRSGHGRALMSAAEGWLAEHGAPKVQLMVRGSNTDVINFYQALGYTDQGVTVLGRFLDPELQRQRERG